MKEGTDDEKSKQGVDAVVAPSAAPVAQGSSNPAAALLV